MTITLYLNKLDLIRDLQTLQTIFQANSPEIVIPLKSFLNPLNISSVPFIDKNNIQIQVTPEEFSLIGIFNSGNF